MTIVRQDEGDIHQLGVARMRVVAQSAANGGSFAISEFEGNPGLWTVPHVHNDTVECFFVLEGSLTFTVNGEDVTAAVGDYVEVPKGAVHVMGGGPEGGRALVAWVPGGLQDMFVELASLPTGSITDPAVRVKIAAKYDSKPVTS